MVTVIEPLLKLEPVKCVSFSHGGRHFSFSGSFCRDGRCWDIRFWKVTKHVLNQSHKNQVQGPQTSDTEGKSLIVVFVHNYVHRSEEQKLWHQVSSLRVETLCGKIWMTKTESKDISRKWKLHVYSSHQTCFLFKVLEVQRNECVVIRFRFLTATKADHVVAVLIILVRYFSSSVETLFQLFREWP